MSDRELLELAAKAAGIDLKHCPDDNNEWVYLKDGKFIPWNSLESPADALRLAVALRLRLEINDASIVVNFTPGDDGDRPTDIYEYLQTVQDENYIIRHVEHLAATMRAITRAAAEMGRRMK